MKTFKIVISLILLLFIASNICDATHYSTDNSNRSRIHKHQHNYESSSGNPPPHRHNTVTDDEIQGLGKYYNNEHKD